MKTILVFFLLSFVPVQILSQSFAEWRAYYNGPLNANDQPWSMALDRQGNVILSGMSQISNGYDLATAKFSSSGQFLWAEHYAGLGATPGGYGYDITTDNAGNVYVGGMVTNSSSTWEMLAIKYNSAGVEKWARTYGTTHQAEARKIMVDASGNVYLMGISWDSYIVLIYDSTGTQQGNITVATGGITPDFTIDNSGNVYLCGSRYETVHNTHDFYFAKYNSSHTLAWQKTYSGPGYYDDKAADIKVDNNGNVYVTGFTTVSPVRSDYLTVKYSASGDSLWARTYGHNAAYQNKAMFLFLDQAANVYVTGIDSSGTGTVKYNSSGVLLWHAFGDMGALMGDAAFDSTHAVIYTDNEHLIKVNSSGQLDYSYYLTIYDTLNAVSIGVNSAGNIFAGGLIYHSSTANDYGVIKYSLTIGIQQISNEVPSGFSLSQNYPNPFNPETRIQFSVPPLKGGRGMTTTKVVVFDILGREVETLVNQSLQPGTYEVSWDASKYPSGVYFYSLSTDGYKETKKMVLVK